MAPMTDCFDSDGVRYRYLYCKAQGVPGRRRPPAILVHGFAQSSSWILLRRSATCTLLTW